MIDWARVEELETEVGTDDFTEIARLFLGEVRETLDGLVSGTVPRASDAFHGLKGCALNLGFSELAGLCAAAEADPRQADLSKLRTAFDLAETAILARYPALAA